MSENTKLLKSQPESEDDQLEDDRKVEELFDQRMSRQFDGRSSFAMMAKHKAISGMRGSRGSRGSRVSGVSGVSGVSSLSSNTNASSIARKMRMTVSTFIGVCKQLGTDNERPSRTLRVSKFIAIEEDDLANELDDDSEDDLRFSLSRLPSSASLFLYHNQEHRIEDPNTYLQASMEIIVCTLIACWVTTFIFNPDVINDNPLKDRLGYDDFCVGWDQLPASAIGIVGATLACFFALRFVSSNEVRMQFLGKKLSPNVHRYGRISSKAFAISAVLMPVIFVIPPTKSVYLHSLPFMCFIVSSALVLLGRFVMFQDELSQGRVLYILFFCLLSITFPMILLGEYLYFTLYGEKSPWPGTITMIVDYSWFALMFLLPFMLPNDIVLVKTTELGYRRTCN